MILHAYVDVYVLWVCRVNHGHGYTTQARFINPVLCIIYHKGMKVYFVYFVDNLHTGFNKNEFNK